MIPRRPRFTLFPYTTLFRSRAAAEAHRRLAVRLEQPAHRPASHLRDRKSTRLNSSHKVISYAVFCVKKKNPGLPGLQLQEAVVRGLRPQLTLALDAVPARAGTDRYFFFNVTPTTEIYTLSLHDALPIRSITLPLVKPVLLVAVLFRILDVLRMFD